VFVGVCYIFCTQRLHDVRIVQSVMVQRSKQLINTNELGDSQQISRRSCHPRKTVEEDHELFYAMETLSYLISFKEENRH
jgi:hypothetical protein